MSSARQTSLTYSPKRVRSMSASSYDSLSNESGRFDDAEESDTEHSAKRRRSNDWPLNESRDSPTTTGGGGRWRMLTGKGSPRAPAASCRHSRADRPRRSRFVEERMSDSVSAKPPSIFTGERGDAKAARGSGIFRFGKAIASAFNPFGGWGAVAGQQEEKGEKDDAVVQAERAYEELKRSGYKGTKSGDYIQHGNKVDPTIADQTWKQIQEKMEYGYSPTKTHVRHDSSGSSQSAATPGRRDTTPFRASLSDLRRAKSAFAIPYIRRNASTQSQGAVSEAPEWPEVRRQKSRKELQKQARLIKKVSNLEEKLDKAKRELRELAGNEELPPNTLCVEKPYHRKFVPGALPSLPSERLLDGHVPLSTSPELEPALSLMSHNIPRIVESHEEMQYELPVKKQSLTPRSPISSKRSNKTLTTDSPLRKRKSPDLGSKRESSKQNDEPANRPQTPAPRKAQKTGMDDSPRSVERKQLQNQLGTENLQYHRSSSPAKRAPKPVTSPRLRMRKGRTNLRSATGNGNDQGREPHTQFPVQEAHGPKPSPAPTRRTRRTSHNSVPPVPPIPKEIACAAAKTYSRFARESGNGRVSRLGTRQSDEFNWPEDCF